MYFFKMWHNISNGTFFPLENNPIYFIVTFAFMQYKVYLFISHFVKTPQTLGLFSSSNITSKKHLTQRGQ